MKRIFTPVITLIQIFSSLAAAYALETSMNIISQAELTDRLYVSTGNRGFLVSVDKGLSWESLNSGLPEKTVYPFDKKEYRRITSFYVDPEDSGRIAVSVSSGVYLSEDGGTSFNGIYRSDNGGKRWKRISLTKGPLYMGSYFYEEISSLAVDDEHDILYIACALDDSLYRKTGASPFERMDVPDLKGETMRSVIYRTGELVLYTDKSSYELAGGNWRRGLFLLPDFLQRQIPINCPEERGRRIKREYT